VGYTSYGQTTYWIDAALQLLALHGGLRCDWMIDLIRSIDGLVSLILDLVVCGTRLRIFEECRQ
jgi:hypothetical protein